MTTNQQYIDLVKTYSARNYHPLPIVIESGKGIFVIDAEGKQYMDMLAAYSAVNFGHSHPKLLQAASKQLQKVTLTSRAFYNTELGKFSKELALLCDMETVLPMNTGAEGVETAIKMSRKWGYTHKGIPENKATIIVCDGNFHGRTTTIISFSDDKQCKNGFGPFTPGFKSIPFGDAQALRNAVDETTAAFIVEPIQGEGGIIIPPVGYLKDVRQICSENNILFIADEIQSGLGRTGKTFACDWENVKPDAFILGKALGGGLVPISAVISSKEIMSVFTPGDHGSTFGGNPLACAIASEVIEILKTNHYQENALKLGNYLSKKLREANFNKVKTIRARGLWIGIELKESAGKARKYCEKLLAHGLLCKETHEQTIRLAPPLCIQQKEIDLAFEKLVNVLS